MERSAAASVEKMGPPVGVPLSKPQRERLRKFIEKHAPGEAEGRIGRIALLYFMDEVENKGPVCILGRVLGL